MSELGTQQRPLRVAIVGAGPSGFYAADALFRTSLTVEVDAFDRLPTPFGLLRAGVAPDHQKMKSVGVYYQRVAEKNADRFRFFGNVDIGKDLSVSELQSFYDAIIFTYGSESDKKTGLPGESLPGVHSAREFVAWYNGHPDYVDAQFDLSQEVVSIIGQGNVAVDVARILAKTPEELAVSDIAQHALEALKNSKVKEIHMIGRRGPVQAAFTELEVRELGHLSDCDILVKSEDLILDAANEEELEKMETNKARKNLEALKELANTPLSGKSKCIEIRFFQIPTEITGTDVVTGMNLDEVKLVGPAFNQTTAKTGRVVHIPSGLIFRSIGYKGVGIEGVPFDSKTGVIPNQLGRVCDLNGQVVSGFYTAGWIKRGPSGVLGTNKPCSTETVNQLIEDLPNLVPCQTPDRAAVQDVLKSRGVRSISFEDWTKLDALEISKGESVGKPREKFVRLADIFKALDA